MKEHVYEIKDYSKIIKRYEWLFGGFEERVGVVEVFRDNVSVRSFFNKNQNTDPLRQAHFYVNAYKHYDSLPNYRIEQDHITGKYKTLFKIFNVYESDICNDMVGYIVYTKLFNTYDDAVGFANKITTCLDSEYLEFVEGYLVN